MRYLLRPHPTHDDKVVIEDRVEHRDHFVLKGHVNVVTGWLNETADARRTGDRGGPMREWVFNTDGTITLPRDEWQHIHARMAVLAAWRTALGEAIEDAGETKMRDLRFMWPALADLLEIEAPQ